MNHVFAVQEKNLNVVVELYNIRNIANNKTKIVDVIKNKNFLDFKISSNFLLLNFKAVSSSGFDIKPFPLPILRNLFFSLIYDFLLGHIIKIT